MKRLILTPPSPTTKSAIRNCPANFQPADIALRSSSNPSITASAAAETITPSSPAATLRNPSRWPVTSNPKPEIRLSRTAASAPHRHTIQAQNIAMPPSSGVALRCPLC